MSASTVLLRNARDLPSPVTLHFENVDFDMEPMYPPSPTSSVRAVFVRSRPGSIDAGNGAHFAHFGMPLDSTDLDDAISPSAFGTARRPFPFPAAAESDTDDAEPDATPAPPARTPRRRSTWAAMHGLRSRVSGVFHRKQPSAPPPTPASSAASTISSSATSSATTSSLEITHATPAPARRTFSFSIRSRSSSIRSAAPVAHIAPATKRATSSPTARRRSRSFSGFTSMAVRLAPISDAAYDANYYACGGDEPEPEVDEVGLEAYRTVRGIGRLWAFDELEIEDGGVLERAVECR